MTGACGPRLRNDFLARGEMTAAVVIGPVKQAGCGPTSPMRVRTTSALPVRCSAVSDFDRYDEPLGGVTMLLADAAQVADSRLFILGGGLAEIGPNPQPVAIALLVDVRGTAPTSTTTGRSSCSTRTACPCCGTIDQSWSGETSKPGARPCAQPGTELKVPMAITSRHCRSNLASGTSGAGGERHQRTRVGAALQRAPRSPTPTGTSRLADPTLEPVVECAPKRARIHYRLRGSGWMGPAPSRNEGAPRPARMAMILGDDGDRCLLGRGGADVEPDRSHHALELLGVHTFGDEQFGGVARGCDGCPSHRCNRRWSRALRRLRAHRTCGRASARTRRRAVERVPRALEKAAAASRRQLDGLREPLLCREHLARITHGDMKAENLRHLTSAAVKSTPRTPPAWVAARMIR